MLSAKRAKEHEKTGMQTHSVLPKDTALAVGDPNPIYIGMDDANPIDVEVVDLDPIIVGRDDASR